MPAEIIDLVSDSDEDVSLRKAATSTLQAFGPRKEKEASRNDHTKPQSFGQTRQQLNPSYAPDAQGTLANDFTQTHPNASIADILRHGAHDAGRSNALRYSQQPSPAAQPINRSRFLQTANGSQQTPTPTAKGSGNKNGSFVHNAPKAATQPAAAGNAHENKRTGGPLYEERIRKFKKFHEQEEARRGTPQRNGQSQKAGTTATVPAGPPSVEQGDAVAGATAASFGATPVPAHRTGPPTAKVGGNEAVNSKRERSSPASGVSSRPDAKRLKPDVDIKDDDGDEIAFSMSEARRLSAAAIPSSLNSAKEVPQVHYGLQAPSGPDGLHDDFSRVPSHQQRNRESLSLAERIPIAQNRETIDLTEDSDHATEPLLQPRGAISFTKDPKESPANKIPVRPTSSAASNETGKITPGLQNGLPQSNGSDSTQHTSGTLLGPSNNDPMHADTDTSSDDSGSGPDEIPAKVTSNPATRLANGPGASSYVSPKLTATTKSRPSTQTIPAGKADSRPSALPHVPDGPSQPTAASNAQPSVRGGGHGSAYSAEEDNLLLYLRDERGTGWKQLPAHFSGRTEGSLHVRHHHLKKLKSAMSKPTSKPKAPIAAAMSFATYENPSLDYKAPTRRHAKAVPRNDGMVSWAEIKAQRQSVIVGNTESAPEILQDLPGVRLDTSHPEPDRSLASPASLGRVLRAREMGGTAGRSNLSSVLKCSVPTVLRNHILDTIGPRRFWHGASRDVTYVAWANDGNRFAAGAIAIDDERSMQYNRPNNLLLGDVEKNSLKELPEHHVPRPAVRDSHNVNSLHAMQESQDPRLFKTVAAVGFSEDSSTLFSAGGDGMVRMYDSLTGSCASSFRQEAEVALLSTNSHGLLASGCHSSNDNSISVLRPGDRLAHVCDLGPSRADVQSSLPVFPSALKWGAGIHSHFLLVGFASDSFDDDRSSAGEVCYWDSIRDHKYELPAVRNVFDVAWNPNPSPSSTLFAVAGAHSNPGRRFRSSIQCFAPKQGRASRVLQWDCPAFDINDVVYCPHDDNLIAAGATDGKVYLWDKRYADRNQAPLHVFAHGPTKNVLDHDRDLEIADTGVRFLSWSVTSDRLYSASSDGVVKVWNPYRTTQDALVKDVATFNSAVMSGAFSPDYRDLLIGEDQSQLNLLGVDREARSVRAAKKFDLYPAPAPHTPAEDKLAPARELLETNQIETRLMGCLPKKQAVQGHRYAGPFLRPSLDYLQRVQNDYDQALEKRDDPRLAILANDAMLRARQKLADEEVLASKASLQQQGFRDARHTWKKDQSFNPVRPCKLDCNYLPAAGDDDGEAPDNRISEQRIPTRLRFPQNVLDATDMTDAEVEDAGLTRKCSACMGPAPQPKRGLAVCNRCALVRSGLTARCEKCAAPMRPNLEEHKQTKNICERCNFHCFRCNQPALVSLAGDTVTCEPCGLQWEASVLGYELNRSFGLGKSNVHMKDHEEDIMESLEQRMGRLFGDGERERLAGGWHVALVDGVLVL